MDKVTYVLNKQIQLSSGTPKSDDKELKKCKEKVAFRGKNLWTHLFCEPLEHQNEVCSQTGKTNKQQTSGELLSSDPRAVGFDSS